MSSEKQEEPEQFHNPTKLGRNPNPRFHERQYVIVAQKIMWVVRVLEETLPIHYRLRSLDGDTAYHMENELEANCTGLLVPNDQRLSLPEIQKTDTLAVPDLVKS